MSDAGRRQRKMPEKKEVWFNKYEKAVDSIDMVLKRYRQHNSQTVLDGF